MDAARSWRSRVIARRSFPLKCHTIRWSRGGLFVTTPGEAFETPADNVTRFSIARPDIFTAAKSVRRVLPRDGRRIRVSKGESASKMNRFRYRMANRQVHNPRGNFYGGQVTREPPLFLLFFLFFFLSLGRFMGWFEQYCVDESDEYERLGFRFEFEPLRSWTCKETSTWVSIFWTPNFYASSEKKIIKRLDFYRISKRGC